MSLGLEKNSIQYPHMKVYGKILLAVLIFAGFLSTGCQPLQQSSSDGKIWVASDMTALTSLTQPFVDKNLVGNEGQVKLFAASNETVSFQIIVDAPDGNVSKLSIAPQYLSGKESIISAGNIRVFRLLPVMVSKYPAWYLRSTSQTPHPAEFYDPLVPIDSPKAGQPYNVKKGERLALWVDVHVPRTATGGDYKGKLIISSGITLKKSLNIELSVYNFVLPDTRPILAAGGFDHRDIFREFSGDEKIQTPTATTHLDLQKPNVQAGLNIIREMMQIAHDHRLDLFDKGLRCEIQRNTKGEFRLNWSNFDQIVKPYLDGSGFADGIPCSVWPIPYTETYPIPDYYGGISSNGYSRMAGEFVSLCTTHFRELDAAKQMFVWPIREKPRADQYEKFIRFASIIKKADPNLPILSNLPATPPEITGWKPPKDFASYVDILAQSGNWFDPAEALKRQSTEEGITGGWLLPGPPPYLPQISVITPPSDVRAIPWFTIKYKCRGIFLPEVLNFSRSIFDSDPDKRTSLFYPGTAIGIDGVLPSVQLKRLRRGLQDAAYIWILRTRNKENIAKGIVNSMVRYAGYDAIGDHYLDPHVYGWVSSGAAWIEARRLMGMEIEGIINPKALSESEKIAARIRWGQFMGKTHSIRIEKISTSVMPSNGNAEKNAKVHTTLRAKILVDLYNEFNHPLDCRLDVTSLPEGWKPVKGSYRITYFKSGARQTAELIVEGTDVPVLADAKMPVGFSISYDERVQHKTGVFVPLVFAGEFSTTPTIDGKLDDWADRENSIAGNFRLLGKCGRIDGSRVFGLAKRQTTVQVMQDKSGKYIYFAIVCSEPAPEKLIAHPSNIIQYEQLLASNEDLVEVLIDPGKQAQTPEDIYHIVIKPNGVVVQEKGIRTNPPLCKSTPVNLDTRVAVAKEHDAWIIEMKIPRSSFGARADSRFWGVNFTRFTTPGFEASSWAKAERNFYDPKSLGTMVLINNK